MIVLPWLFRRRLLHAPPDRSEAFELLAIRRLDNRYLQRFLEFHRQDIERFFPDFRLEALTQPHLVFILRDMLPVGVVICEADAASCPAAAWTGTAPISSGSASHPSRPWGRTCTSGLPERSPGLARGYFGRIASICDIFSP